MGCPDAVWAAFYGLLSMSQHQNRIILIVCLLYIQNAINNNKPPINQTAASSRTVLF